jgi:hypothetical protein
MPVIAPPSPQQQQQQQQQQRFSYHWRTSTPIPTPGIDLLASAAEYVQREEERVRKNNRTTATPDVISFYHHIPTNPSVT